MNERDRTILTAVGHTLRQRIARLKEEVTEGNGNAALAEHVHNLGLTVNELGERLEELASRPPPKLPDQHVTHTLVAPRPRIINKVEVPAAVINAEAPDLSALGEAAIQITAALNRAEERMSDFLSAFTVPPPVVNVEGDKPKCPVRARTVIKRDKDGEMTEMLTTYEYDDKSD
jgi:hypothetical protein